jgi:phosphate regulon transcriptional regulator PhoB
MNATILVVDDEPTIRDVLAYNLERAHYRVLQAEDGEGALQLARERCPDLIILDLMLPGMDGFDVCRALRQEGRIPIIMLTALDEEIDRVLGLELGADDYVVKPFSIRELMARVKSVLRRSRPSPSPPETNLGVAGLIQDADRHLVAYQGQEIQLSPLEFALLETLMRHPGIVLTRHQLLDQVWNYDYHGDLRTVDTTVKRLRRKLRLADNHAAELVQTVRGVGYRISEP